MTTLNISYSDPANKLAAKKSALEQTLKAVVNYLDQYLVFSGAVDIEVRVDSTSTGRLSASGDIVASAPRNGLTTYESALEVESRTGVDPKPGNADVVVYIDPTSSYFDSLWFDPNIANSVNGKVVSGQTDAFTVLLHEMLHGMGIIGWRNVETGALPGGYQSLWDSMVSVQNGKATFNGANVVNLIGSGVEVRLGGSQGANHLGAGPTLADSRQQWIEADLMNGYYFYYGERYTIGRMDLAILKDLGWQLKPSTLFDVVNPWDRADTPLWRVGYDSNDLITGGPRSDKLEGRGGDDTVVGNGGDDIIDGGAGYDTLVLSGRAAEYRITETGTSVNVRGTNSADASVTNAVNVERLKFSDFSVKLDMTDTARLVSAKQLGTLQELYVAFFNRVPDAEGLSYWITEAAGGRSIDSIADAFYSSAVAFSTQTGYSASMSSAAFVNTIYRNVLGRKDGADADGLSYWTQALDTGAKTRGQLVTSILDSAHTFHGDAQYGYVADLLNNKIAVAQQFAVTWGLSYNDPATSITQGQAIAAAVTPQGIGDAVALIGVAGSMALSA